jgi:hypothetical protein
MVIKAESIVEGLLGTGYTDLMSQNEIETVAMYSEEAYWDLVAAKKLIQFLRFESCNRDEEVFYLGRRVLYLLQQASEKAIKAYLIAYFKPFIRALMLPKNARIDRSKQPQIFIVYRLVKDIADLITVKNLGHEPGITVFKAMCNLYELTYRNRYALNDYIKFYAISILQSILKNNGIELNKNQKLVKEIAEAIIALKPIRQYMNSIMTFKLPAEEEKELEKKCSESKNSDKRELLKSITIPCINKDVLRLLENTQKYFEEEIINEAKNQITLQKILDEASSLLEELTKVAIVAIAILNSKETLIDEELKADIIKTIRDMISNELSAKGKISTLQQLAIHLSFGQYIMIHTLKVDQCLALYERLGRYPGRTPESNEIISEEAKEAICRDLQMIPKLVESIEYLVLKVRESMKTLQEIKSDYLLHNLFNLISYS